MTTPDAGGVDQATPGDKGGRAASARLSIAAVGSVLWRRRSLRKRESWSAEQLREFQQRRLAELRAFALERSPFYRDFHAGLERAPLEELPILTKRQLMERWDQICTDPGTRLADVQTFLRSPRPSPTRFANKYFAAATSGSSGHPGVFIYDEDEWRWVLASYSRANEWAGVVAGPLHHMKLAVVSTTKPWHQSAVVGASLQSSIVPTLRLDATAPIEAIVDALNEQQPRALVAYATMALALALEQIDGRLNIAPEAVFCASEVLSHSARIQITDAFGALPFETYAATETAGIASDCRHHKMHLYEDLVISEVVDEDGNEAALGKVGDRFLATVLFSRTLPLIRYELDDRVVLSDQPCSCSLPFKVLDEVQGRTEDALKLKARDSPNLISIHPNVFHDVLDPAPIAGWQVVQESEVRVIVRVVPQTRVPAPLLSLQAQLENGVRAAGVDAKVEVQSVSELEHNAAGKVTLIKANSS